MSNTLLRGKKILFANFPGDGHFNPLTGLAVYLKELGCDVRWYTSDYYERKLRNLEIPHYTFKKALNINNDNSNEIFPEREKIKGKIAKLNFDIINAFIKRGPEYYADLLEIHREFPFEIMVADCAFTGVPFVTDKMNIPVIAIGVMPLYETSKDLPPSGLGLPPSNTFFGRIKQNLLRFAAGKILFRRANKTMQAVLEENGIEHFNLGVFDIMLKKANLLLQSGSPGFEYYRSDLGKNIRFIGSLLPYRAPSQQAPWFDERLNQFEKIVVLTQGTVEKNTEKLIVPALEALKNTDVLVVATTGGSGTAELKKQFPQNNLIIEDFIPFADIMPYADVYITNGGYGGVMLGIKHELPLVVAGVHEGKNEINARIGYFRLGINLGTESPQPAQIKKAVEKILDDSTYRENVKNLARELSTYHPNELTARYITEVLQNKGKLFVNGRVQDGEKTH